MSYWNRFGKKALRGRSSLTMSILITGGFGFVGGRLAVHLAQAGYQIVLGSRNASSPPVWLPQAEVVQIVWEDDRTLVRCCDGVDGHVPGVLPWGEMPNTRLAQARVVYIATVPPDLDEYGQTVAFHPPAAPAIVAVCWADVAGGWVAEALLGMDGDVDHLACGLLHEFRLKRLLR